jgi:cytochrome b561
MIQNVNSNPKTNKWHKINHWLLFILFLGLFFTAVMNTTFYSKEAIMKSFEYSFFMTGLEAGYADQLFIARMERREGWVFHFYLGVAFFALSLVRLFFYLRTKNKKLLTLSILFFSFLLFISGFPLYIRAFVDISMDIQNPARTMHFYSAWILGLLIVYHIVNIIKKENRSDQNLVSNMLKFSFALFLVLPITHAHANDPYYLEALQYYEGKKGLIEIEKKVPNCPYDKCKQANSKLKHKDLPNGMKLYYITKKNYKKAYELFLKSAQTHQNLYSAQHALKILLQRLNYKDQEIDRILIRKLHEEMHLSLKDAKRDIQKLLFILTHQNDCYGLYHTAYFHQNGYLDFKKSAEIAGIFYKQALEFCPKDSLYYLKSKSSL